MKNLFIYGTLAHISLLEVVLGRQVNSTHLREAKLPDFAAYWVMGQAYPMIGSQNGAVTYGMVLTDLTDHDLARLDYYEGGFGYKLKSLQLDTPNGVLQAGIYFPDQEPQRGADWQLADWVAEWGDMTVHAANEAMGYYGQITPDELAARFDVIRRRAASYIRGQTESGRQSDRSRADATVVHTRTPYSNFYAMQELDLRHRQFSGEMSDQMERAAFVGFDVAIVLPYDPVRDCVLLVEQFRVGALARGTNQPWLLEPVAGHIDVGETPQQAAMRETVEESGVQLTKLIPIINAYPSPGASTEYYYMFLGLCDLGGAGGRVSGVADENEDIHSHILSFDEFMEFIDASAINGAGGSNVLPLIAAAYWLARNRESLRQGA